MITRTSRTGLSIMADDDGDDDDDDVVVVDDDDDGGDDGDDEDEEGGQARVGYERTYWFTALDSRLSAPGFRLSAPNPRPRLPDPGFRLFAEANPGPALGSIPEVPGHREVAGFPEFMEFMDSRAGFPEWLDSRSPCIPNVHGLPEPWDSPPPCRLIRTLHHDSRSSRIPHPLQTTS